MKISGIVFLFLGALSRDSIITTWLPLELKFIGSSLFWLCSPVRVASWINVFSASNFSSSFVGIGGIPSAITEVGFFIRGVGTECNGGGNSEGKVGVLTLSIGSTERGGNSGHVDDPMNKK